MRLWSKMDGRLVSGGRGGIECSVYWNPLPKDVSRDAIHILSIVRADNTGLCTNCDHSRSSLTMQSRLFPGSNHCRRPEQASLKAADEDRPGHELGVATQDDVCPPACHVGGNGDGALPAGLSHNLRFPFHVLGLCVEQLVVQACKQRTHLSAPFPFAPAMLQGLHCHLNYEQAPLVWNLVRMFLAYTMTLFLSREVAA